MHETNGWGVLLWARGDPDISLHVLRAFLPAAEAGLWPQGIVCPAASNWADWAPGTATGQTGHMSPAVGTSMLYICSYTYSH